MDTETRTLQIQPLDDSNRAAVMAFSTGISPLAGELLDWRYRDCPSMEAAVAMAGDECVATMFALRRTYHTPAGPRQFLEPFSWHANEDWRAQAPGLRLARYYMMKQPKPMVAVAGTDNAAGLLTRLKWPQLGTADRYVLPLSGRYLEKRGRGKLVARAFDLLGRVVFTPRRPRSSVVTMESAPLYTPQMAAVAAQQQRFALMRLPDEATAQWLSRAPEAAGRYVAFHARANGEVIGWVWCRIFTHEGLRVGELLEVFAGDQHRYAYAPMVAETCATMAEEGVDVIRAATTCPDTIAALKALRFRPDNRRPVFVFFGKEELPQGPVLVDGGISDHAFFPLG